MATKEGGYVLGVFIHMILDQQEADETELRLRRRARRATVEPPALLSLAMLSMLAIHGFHQLR
jgi:hypothetical protein